MTTQEAYKMAATLHGTGLSMKKISKELARNGYLSAKTGRPLLPISVYRMVTLAKGGHVPVNKVNRKHVRYAHTYAPRGPRKAKPLTKKIPTLPLTTLEMAASMPAFTTARQEIEGLVAKFTSTAKALTTLLEAVK